MAQEYPSTDPYQPYIPPEEPYQPPQKKGPSWILIVVIVLLVLCCCCVATTLLFYFVLGDMLTNALGITYLIAPFVLA
jgi:hypothetical protein